MTNPKDTKHHEDELVLDRVTKNFDGVVAVKDVGFTVNKCQIKALIGPNGAGKTTLFNLITGTIPLSNGSIYFRDKEITGFPTHQISRLGISRTFQHPRLFSNVSIEENVMMGAYNQTKSGILNWAFRKRSFISADRDIRRKARERLDRVGISLVNESVERLSTGQEKLVEIARAIMPGTKMILMDEPAAGLNEKERQHLAEMIVDLREEGLTIFIVEHNMDLVMRVSDEIVVIDHGQKIAEGLPEEIKENPKVIEAYLGSEAL